MSRMWLGPIGAMREVETYPERAVSVERASSSLVALDGRQYIQRAPRGPRMWEMPWRLVTPDVLALLTAAASGALPGPLFLYAGDAARTNLLAADVAAPCMAGTSALGSVAGSVAVRMPSGVESLTGVVQQPSAGAWSAAVPVRSQVAYVLSGWGSAAGALIEWRTVSAGGVPVASGALSAAAVEGGFYGAVELSSGTAAGLQVRLAAGSRTVGGLRLVEGVLPSSGAVLRRNLVPNPSFEEGIDGVASGGGATVSRTGGSMRPERVGSYMLSVAIAGATSPTWARQIVPVSGVDGQWVAFSALVGRSVSVSHARIMARCVDAGGANLGDALSPYLTLPSTNLDRLTVSRQIPVGTVNIQFFLWFYGAASVTPPQDGTALTDGWQATIAPTEAAALAQVEPYFDGSTAPEPHRYVAWAGAPHASSSTERILPDAATWPARAPGRGDPPVVGDDRTETLQLVTTSEILADYTVTIREVG